MYLDKETLFADGDTITRSGPAAHVVDLGTGDIGPAENASLFVSVRDFAGTGTVTVHLETSDAVDGTGALSAPTTLASFPLGNTTLKSGGKMIAMRMPHGMQRYAGLEYEVEDTVTAGVWTAGIVWDVES